MKTIWTGQELIMEFDCTLDTIRLSVNQTKEFEEWVLKRVKG